MHWLHEVSGRPYWSLAQHVKTKIGPAQRYIATFRHASLQAAEAQASTASSAGTSTRPSSWSTTGLVYCNDGDWVESCTALVERPNGALELLTWRPQTAVAPLGQPLRDAAYRRHSATRSLHPAGEFQRASQRPDPPARGASAREGRHGIRREAGWRGPPPSGAPRQCFSSLHHERLKR